MGKRILGILELPFCLKICYLTVCLRQDKRIKIFIENGVPLNCTGMNVRVSFNK